jgi:D-alanine-D-alanine ligase
LTRLRIAVLMGGPSPERDVSLATGQEIVRALDPRRYHVLPVEITKEGRWLPRPDLAKLSSGTRDPSTSSGRSQGPGTGSTPSVANSDSRRSESRVTSHESRLVRGPTPVSFDEAVDRDQVDVAFIAMHGPYGEDGTVQGLLELLGIPYTGSGVLASALAMDKLRSRQLFEWQRIPVPAYVSITADVWSDRGCVHHEVAQHLGYPCVVKPNAVGSSIGVSLVRERVGLDPAVALAFRYGPLVLIEEYVAGTEITCGIVDDPATGVPMPMPLVEIVPHADFYNYDSKYAPGGSEHIVPARVPEDVAQRAQALAVRVHQALGCEGMSRVDMIARGMDIVVLEANTIPGMTSTSLLPDAANAAGIVFPQLLDRIIESALRRSRLRSSQSPQSSQSS